jgi:predicted amidohydrolase YtcJ
MIRLFLLPLLASTNHVRADTRCVNARIYTLDARQPQVTALYEIGTRIAFVGSESLARLEPDQKLSREQALRSYGMSAACSVFEEGQKGSPGPREWADFTGLDRNIV